MTCGVRAAERGQLTCAAEQGHLQLYRHPGPALGSGLQGQGEREGHYTGGALPLHQHVVLHHIHVFQPE